jgi:chemotaxis-related protein WspB
MLFLLFQLGNDRYALEAGRVLEVAPLAALRAIPRAPQAVAGVFNYRGRPVPVIDLSELTLGYPARDLLSTRIIMIRYPDRAGREQPLGLIAERATQIIRRDPADFAEPGLKLGLAPYLGPVLMDSQGSVQWIQEQHLLPEPVRNLLFDETAWERA